MFTRYSFRTPTVYSKDIEEQLVQWILVAQDQRLPIQCKAIQ